MVLLIKYIKKLFCFFIFISLKTFIFLHFGVDLSSCESENDIPNDSIDDEDDGYDWFHRHAWTICDCLLGISTFCFFAGEYLNRPPDQTIYERYCEIWEVPIVDATCFFFSELFRLIAFLLGF
jgi:hypothetical protein